MSLFSEQYRLRLRAIDIYSRALNKLIEGLPDLKRLGQFAKFKKKDKITDAVAKAGRELAKLVQKFIVRPLTLERLHSPASLSCSMFCPGGRPYHRGSDAERIEAEA